MSDADTKPSRIVRIPPPLWALAALVVAAAFHFALTWTANFRAPLLGAALIAAGLALAAWGRLAFARVGTEILPASRVNSTLVTDGPFRFSRNPMYLGGIVISLGIALAVGTLPFYLVPVFLAWLIARHFIPFEEAKMERQFGDAFRDYKARVRRWL